MKKNFGGLRTLDLAVLFGIVVLMVLLGSFFDLSFAEKVYSPNSAYSQFFEYAGTFPASAVVASSGVLLDYYFRKVLHKSWIGTLLLVFITLAVGAMWGYDTFHSLMKSVYAVLLGLPFLFLSNVFFYLTLKDADPSDFLRKAIVLLSAGLFVLLVTFGLKNLVVRPRFYALKENLSGSLSAYFRPWWAFSRDKSGPLASFSSFELQSWPSGHSSFSALLFLGLAYSDVKTKDEKKKHLVLFLCILLWMLLTGFSRVVGGYHYLSDVGFGWFFGLLGVSLGFLIAYRPARKKEAKAA